MTDDEKNLIKVEMRLEFKEMFHEQDIRIVEILDTQKELQKNQKVIMEYIENQKSKPLAWVDKIIWTILGALLSKGVPFIIEKFK